MARFSKRTRGHCSTGLRRLRRFHASRHLWPHGFRVFALPVKGTLQLSLTLLLRYRSQDVFRVGAWCAPIHARFPTHVTQNTRHHPPRCPYRTITLSGAPFQETSGSVVWVDAGSQLHISTRLLLRIRIALFPLRSPLLRESLLISFLLPTKMLQSGRFPYPNGYALQRSAGCPIR